MRRNGHNSEEVLFHVYCQGDNETHGIRSTLLICQEVYNAKEYDCKEYSCGIKLHGYNMTV